MSQQYSSSTSYTSYSSSTQQSGDSAPQVTSQRFAEESYTDPVTGTTTRRAAQTNDEPPVSQTVNMPAGGGRATITGYGGRDEGRRIEDVSQSEKDREYEERIEDEYAKREGKKTKRTDDVPVMVQSLLNIDRESHQRQQQ
ncbi:MAG: hypothetical protein Q9227_004797 [Pyrenula ochraceoflavens]